MRSLSTPEPNTKPNEVGLCLKGRRSEDPRSFHGTYGNRGSGAIRTSSDVVARQEGFEPPTYCLEGSCSILLSYWRISYAPHPTAMERVMGIEPTYPAWKAGVLPLNYTRMGRFHIQL